MEDVDEPRLTVSGAARRLGIAPATLRTWDRRYGIGPTDHARGRHRRYSADDMARLELMQRALMQGAAPAEAARYARSAGLPLARPRRRRGRRPTTPPLAAEAARPVRMAPVAVGSAVTAGAAQPAAAGVPRCGCRAPAPGPAGSAAPRWRWTPSPMQRLVEESHRGRRAGRHLGRGGAPGAGRGRGAVGDHRPRGGGRAPAQPVPHRGLRRAGAAPRPRRSPPGRSCSPAMPSELHVVPLAVLAALLAERGSAAGRSEPPSPPTPSPRPCAGPRPPPSCSGPRLRRPRTSRRRHRTAGHPAALPDIRRGARLERRGPAAGRGCARLARRRGRADRGGRAALSGVRRP